MKHCPRCTNKYIPDNAKYCIQCGYNFDDELEMPDFIKRIFTGEQDGTDNVFK